MDHNIIIAETDLQIHIKSRSFCITDLEHPRHANTRKYVEVYMEV